MSAEYTLKLDPEKIREMPMVDLAFEVLKAANTSFYYRDLMHEIAKLRNLSEDQINEVIAQLYTEINIDGRFACVGSNVWGLKRWYPVERDTDGTVATGAKRPRIINDEDDDDEELFAEDEEEVLEEESFDLFDEDREEIFDEGEEDADVEDDVALDDEENAELDGEDLDDDEMDEDNPDEEANEDDDFADNEDDLDK